MNALPHRSDCEVAVIGAGPYGLATAAHLNVARVATVVFGDPMSYWRDHMPEGMLLRSPWAASHIAHPNGDNSLDAYARLRGFAPHEQMSVQEFIRYGSWFQSQAVPDVDLRKVTRVERHGQDFRLRLNDGEIVQARRVVVAMGLARQDHRPSALAGLPPALCTHSSQHVKFDRFRDKRVAVVGRGQSACESAALLSETGAEVELICRDEVLWLGREARKRGESGLAFRLRTLLATRGAVGPFPLNWLAEAPTLAHLMPASLRAEFSARCLRPKASGWLRHRFDKVTVNAGRTIEAARVEGDRVALDLDNGTRTFDHVLSATGYHIDIARLGIIAPALLNEIAASDGAPHLVKGMESSVPGLHFVGATAVHSFGPLMRFVWGAGFAARALTRKVLAEQPRMRPATRAAVELFGRQAGPVTRS